MKLYRISNESGLVIGWAGTQADAKTTAKDKNGDWKETEVPTDKPSLLSWLNTHAVDTTAGE